ncbi:TPA: dTDP-4-dehydrorhamnose 3,5-epimerase, partial [Candidatus Sumerlaeota bacterium]|nr:dTDP-4-dehydrorhamnose 3,5-epimerase [Candidatus Sumerlaeota bacterium]
MLFTETPLPGAYLIEPERLSDERGFFARTFCEQEFDAHGLLSRFVQCSISFNVRKGTLRGMHYQAAPHEETKLVRGTQGALCDVLVDMRPDSPTYLQWYAAELTAENRKALYIPAGFA